MHIVRGTKRIPSLLGFNEVPQASFSYTNISMYIKKLTEISWNIILDPAYFSTNVFRKTRNFNQKQNLENILFVN